MSSKKQVCENVTPQNQGFMLDNGQIIAPVVSHKLSDICLEKITKQAVMATTSKNQTKESFKENTVVVSEMLKGINPRDEIEAMIAGQMIAIHGAVMMACTRASLAPCDVRFLKDEAINHTTKLNKSFTSLVETLNRYRHQDKIYQNLTAGHVDVHHGGQAVVGNITQQ